MAFYLDEFLAEVSKLNTSNHEALVAFHLKFSNALNEHAMAVKAGGVLAGEELMAIFMSMLIENNKNLSQEAALEKVQQFKQSLEAIYIALNDNKATLIKPLDAQQKEEFDSGLYFLMQFYQAHHFLEGELKTKDIAILREDKDFKTYITRLELQSIFLDEGKKLLGTEKASRKNIFEIAAEVATKNPKMLEHQGLLHRLHNKPEPLLKKAQAYLENPTQQNLEQLTLALESRGKAQQKADKKMINNYLKTHQTPQNTVAARKIKSITKSELVRAKHFVQKKLFGVGKEVIKEPSTGNEPLPNSKFTAVETQAVLKKIYDKYAMPDYNYDSNNGQIYRETDKRFLKDLLGMPTLEKAFERIRYIQSSKGNMHQLGYVELALPLTEIQAILADPLQHAQSLQQPPPNTSQYQELTLGPAPSSNTPYQTISDVVQSAPPSSRPAPVVISTYGQKPKPPEQGHYAELTVKPVSSEVVEKFKQFSQVLEGAKTVVDKGKPPPNSGQVKFKDALQHYHGSSTPKSLFSENFNFKYRAHENASVVAQINTLQRDLKDALEFALTKPTEAEATKHLMNVINHLAQMMPEGMMTDFQQEVTAALQKDAPSARVNPSSKP